MKNITLVISAISSVLFVSCDPTTTGNYYIDNKSNRTIYVDRGIGIDTVKSKEVKTIASVSGLGMGQISGAAQYSTVKVYSDSGICKKDIAVDSNWIETNPKKYLYEHRFLVEDGDF